MKQVRNILWGVALVAAGVLLGLNALEITHINIFFDGWWTVFILVPCVIGLFSEKDKMGNIIGIIVGLLLLAGCQDWLSFDLLWKLAVPAVVVLIGLKIIFKDLFAHKAQKGFDAAQSVAGKLPQYAATFSGQKVNFAGQVFTGADMTAVFGGIDCDLRGAIINNDVPIRLTAVFGGIDVIVPAGVQVKVVSNSLFGGVSNKYQNSNVEGAPTVYVHASCIFGGADLK